MRVVYFGSGSFGLPTLEALVARHEVALVVTQPDRPAGRRRSLTSTPVASFADEQGLRVFKPESPNTTEAIEHIHQVRADAFVVIAYGHKLCESLLDDYFAINLHGSLLPKYRGAAPINWAMIENESDTGVSVIGLAQRMDAGLIYAQRSTRIDPLETAGELHDRLAAMGHEVMLDVLAKREASTLQGIRQDDSQASKAPKLTKADGVVRFDQPAPLVRARIHGLTPWPGCTARIGDQTVKFVRVRDVDHFVDQASSGGVEPGSLLSEGRIACKPGAIEIIEIQPAGGRVMRFEDFARGHDVRVGERCMTE